MDTLFSRLREAWVHICKKERFADCALGCGHVSQNTVYYSDEGHKSMLCAAKNERSSTSLGYQYH
jgi:hypothetical protein